MTYDFVIFTAGRAGSHLLATLLNSHPDIACEGEFGKLDTLINAEKTYGSVKGCILAYGQRKLLVKWRPAKVIHMVRSPELGAESYAKNVIRYKARVAGTICSSEPTLTRGQIAATVCRLRVIQKISRDILKDFNYLEVSYEELTHNNNISWMPVSICDKVCGFLGVESRDLWTDLTKRK